MQYKKMKKKQKMLTIINYKTELQKNLYYLANITPKIKFLQHPKIIMLKKEENKKHIKKKNYSLLRTVTFFKLHKNLILRFQKKKHKQRNIMENILLKKKHFQKQLSFKFRIKKGIKDYKKKLFRRKFLPYEYKNIEERSLAKKYFFKINKFFKFFSKSIIKHKFNLINIRKKWKKKLKKITKINRLINKNEKNKKSFYIKELNFALASQNFIWKKQIYKHILTNKKLKAAKKKIKKNSNSKRKAGKRFFN